MARLDVVVADGDGIIAHVGSQTRIDVRGKRVYIVEVVRRVVSLKAVPGVNQQNIIRPSHRTDAVHDGLDCKERLLHSPADVGGIEIASMHVVGSQNLEDIVPILGSRTAAGQQKSGGSGGDDRLEYPFHTL